MITAWDILPRHDVLPLRRHHRGAGLCRAASRVSGFASHRACTRTSGHRGQSRQMILQGDTARADEGEIQGAHGVKTWEGLRRSGATR